MGIVYILTNEAMPGLIKIGITGSTLAQRMLQLDNTSVPLPVECYYAAEVEDELRVEKALHTALGDHRVRHSREFFRVDPFRARAVPELVAIREVTPKGPVVETQEDAEALQRSKAQRPPFRFPTADVPVGAVLVFSRDQSQTATVLDERRIAFRGETTSLSAAALTLMQEQGFRWTALAGPDYWLYEGQPLTERRLALEMSAADDSAE